MAWLYANHGIILSSFVFVYKQKLATKDGRCRGLTKAKGLGLGTLASGWAVESNLAVSNG